MSTMSLIDLQCQEAMSAIELTLDRMGFYEAVPALVAVEVAEQAAHMLTPIESWECTLPYLLDWTYEHFDVEVPTLN